MATAAEDLNNQSDPNEADLNAAPDGKDEIQDSGEDSPYADLAKEMGWVPRDQFTGAADDWKPADQFIRDGRDIQRETSRELKTVRAQLDTIAKTSASIVEQQVNERVGELTARYNKAVEDGDPKQAYELAGEIHSLTAQDPAGTPQPSPEAQSWVERNSGWFQKPGFEYATARAIEITNMLQKQGYTDHAQQLKIAEQQLRREHPELFGGQKNGKPAPGVHSPSSRTSGPSNRAKGFSDMPKAAQDIARDMADRGVIKSTDDYAKNYFANLAAKG